MVSAQTDKIEMVDLKRQYHRLKPQFDSAISEVLENTAFINGPQVGHFATELASYLNVDYVIPCANGTDALQLVLMAYGFPAGSEVIVPSFNYVAAAETVVFMGLKPVFVEVDPDTFNIDVASAEKAITAKTVAIMAVHLFGQCADMDQVLALAKAKNLVVIEDNAQAIGSEYVLSAGPARKAGAMGNVGTTSFFPSKNLGCMGDGGAVYTQDADLAQKIKMLANHGQKTKYHYEMVGINSRLDTLQAAILRVKLEHLDDFAARRQAAASVYDSILSSSTKIQIPVRQPKSTHVFHQYTLKVQGDRNALQLRLKEAGIPSMIYYPRPLHIQAAFGYLGYKEGDFPISEQLCRQVISLPIHTEFLPGEPEMIAEKVLEFL